MGLPLYTKIEDEYIEINALIAGANLKPITTTTISYAINQYLETITSQKCIKNQKSEASFFRLVMEFLLSLGLLNIDQVLSMHIEQIEILLLKRMQPVSLNRRFNSLRNFFNKCKQWGFIHDNPFTEIKPKDIVENHFKVWTQENFEQLIETTGGVHKNLIMFLYLTGCRPIEARNLKWTDIDHANKRITLQCGKNQGGSRYLPKTERVSKLLHSIKIDSLYVFTKNKKHIENQNLSHYVKSRLRKLGLGHLSVYGLRHTFASSLNNEGVTAFVIKELMGHSQIKTTLKYIKNSENSLIAGLEKANR